MFHSFSFEGQGHKAVDVKQHVCLLCSVCVCVCARARVSVWMHLLDVMRKMLTEVFQCIYVLSVIVLRLCIYFVDLIAFVLCPPG